MWGASALDLAGTGALVPVYIEPAPWHAQSIACRIGMNIARNGRTTQSTVYSIVIRGERNGTLLVVIALTFCTVFSCNSCKLLGFTLFKS